MNLFIVDEDPYKAAQQNVDSHVIKIVMEAAELLGYVFMSQGLEYPLKWVNLQNRHFYHPMAKILRQARGNFNWSVLYLDGLLREFEYRRDKKHKYDVEGLFQWIYRNRSALKFPNESSEQAPWPRCFGPLKGIIPETNSIVDDYRNYYILGKQHLRKYTKRETPEWFIEKK